MVMGEPIDTHIDKQTPSQGRHARQAAPSARHARVMVPCPVRSRDKARYSAGASRVAHNGAFIRGGGSVIGGSSWFGRRRTLAVAAVVLAVVVIAGVFAAHGHAGANDGDDQGAAQDDLESQAMETA